MSTPRTSDATTRTLARVACHFEYALKHWRLASASEALHDDAAEVEYAQQLLNAFESDGDFHLTESTVEGLLGDAAGSCLRDHLLAGVSPGPGVDQPAATESPGGSDKLERRGVFLSIATLRKYIGKGVVFDGSCLTLRENSGTILAEVSMDGVLLRDSDGSETSIPVHPPGICYIGISVPFRE